MEAVVSVQKGVGRRRGEARPESASMSWFRTTVHTRTAATGARVDGELQTLQNRSGGGVGGEGNGCTRRRRGGSVACAAGPTQKRRQE
ncbi:hypothetical protein IG631_11060 [Alternaria alternata]|nr:hypothetical protein IG631_11060 [Alternaria alternata]